MRIRMFLLVLAVSFAALAPAASANSVSYALSCGGTSCGSVQIKDISGGVSVKIHMSGGYTIQASAANSFTFNTVSKLTLTLSGFSTTEFGAVSASLSPGVNDGAGKFTWGVVQFGIPNGKTSVSGATFNIMGMTTADLLANKKGNVVSVHYCEPVNGAISLNCSPNTGFANSTPSTVPEPGTLSLLGTGLVGLAGLVRRRFLR